MFDQTIWLPPRATGFTEACELCEEEHPEWARTPAASVAGTLPLGQSHGWATCPRGHQIRVLRMGAGMPAGALR